MVNLMVYLVVDVMVDLIAKLMVYRFFNQCLFSG